MNHILCLNEIIDGHKITGHLHLPSRSKPPVVIGSHGLFATQESPKQIALAKACNLLGMAYFRFDHRGCGRSEGGKYEQVSFQARCEDLLRICEIIRKRSDTSDEIAIFGSSLGGAVACRVSTIVQTWSLVTFAAPVSSKCVIDSVSKSAIPIKHPEINLKGLAFDNERILENIKNILVVHGEHDEVVPVSEAYGIFRKARNPKRMIIQKCGDHRMSNSTHQESFVNMAADWLGKGFERS